MCDTASSRCTTLAAARRNARLCHHDEALKHYDAALELALLLQTFARPEATPMLQRSWDDVAEVARYQHAPFAWLRGVGYEVIPRAVAKSQG